MSVSKRFAWSVFGLQLFFILLFAFFTKYGEDVDASHFSHNKRVSDGGQDPRNNSLERHYPYFQDINFMVFFGIGYLYAFLWKYGYSGVTMNFLLCAISVQWGILSNYFWMVEKDWKMQIDISSLIKGEFAAASAVIALGGIFGKVGILQMIVFALLEVVFYGTVYNCNLYYFQISDAAESVALHLFAAVFGLSATYVIDRNVQIDNNPNEIHSQTSNLLCLLGSIVLWVFWPSFNSVLDESDSQHRNVVNTFLALIGSAISCFATSSLLHKDGKFVLSHIQNGALAGAVGIGCVSNMMISLFGALLIGAVSGCICVTGFKYLSPFLAKLKIYDPCGIHSLHALPGFLSGILGIIVAYFADYETYGYSLYKLYPARAPLENTTAMVILERDSPIKIEPGLGRSPESQALYQLIYLSITILASCCTGLLTGAIVRLNIFDPIEPKQMFLDEVMFDMSDIKVEETKSEIINNCNIHNNYKTEDETKGKEVANTQF